MSEIETDEYRISTTEHYDVAMSKLRLCEDYGVDSPHRLNLAIEALAYTMLGGLASELEYKAEVRARELAESKKSGYGAAGAGEDGARFEEDDDRP